jgi:hypothetical protein
MEGSVSDLDNAAIDADVGILEPTAGKTLPQCHQSLAPHIKQMATAVQTMLKSIRDPIAMGDAATQIAAGMAAAVEEVCYIDDDCDCDCDCD